MLDPRARESAGVHQTIDDVLAEAQRVLCEASLAQVPLRLLGGAAVQLLAGPEPILARVCGDIDLATTRARGGDAARLLTELGYQPDVAFNGQNGHRRLLFWDRRLGRQVDVFVGEFSMCHVIPLEARLTVHPFAIPLEHLVLTKLQIFELNSKDQSDILSLLYHHEVTAGGNENTIDAVRIASLCAADWGLCRTVQLNVERTRAALGSSGLACQQQALVLERLELLWRHVDEHPKPAKWRLRARIGDRVSWHDEPEEVDSTSPAAV